MSRVINSSPTGLLDEMKPYLVDEADTSTTYICFDDAPTTRIHRIKKTGTVTEYTWTFGNWSDRTSIAAAKWAPINKGIEID